MTAVRVHVTQQDIDNGIIDGCKCPISLALMRVLPPDVHWHVGNGVLFKGEPDGTMPLKPSYPLPREARIFISRFDGGIPVEPFEFDLDVPDDLLAGAS